MFSIPSITVVNVQDTERSDKPGSDSIIYAKGQRTGVHSDSVRNNGLVFLQASCCAPIVLMQTGSDVRLMRRLPENGGWN